MVPTVITNDIKKLSYLSIFLSSLHVFWEQLPREGFKSGRESASNQILWGQMCRKSFICKVGKSMTLDRLTLFSSVPFIPAIPFSQVRTLGRLFKGTEFPGHRQAKLTQTLIVCLLKASLFSYFRIWPPPFKPPDLNIQGKSRSHGKNESLVPVQQ